MPIQALKFKGQENNKDARTYFVVQEKDLGLGEIPHNFSEIIKLIDEKKNHNKVLDETLAEIRKNKNYCILVESQNSGIGVNVTKDGAKWKVGENNLGRALMLSLGREEIFKEDKQDYQDEVITVNDNLSKSLKDLRDALENQPGDDWKKVFVAQKIESDLSDRDESEEQEVKQKNLEDEDLSDEEEQENFDEEEGEESDEEEAQEEISDEKLEMQFKSLLKKNKIDGNEPLSDEELKKRTEELLGSAKKGDDKKEKKENSDLERRLANLLEQHDKDSEIKKEEKKSEIIEVGEKDKLSPKEKEGLAKMEAERVTKFVPADSKDEVLPGKGFYPVGEKDKLPPKEKERLEKKEAKRVTKFVPADSKDEAPSEKLKRKSNEKLNENPLEVNDNAKKSGPNRAKPQPAKTISTITVNTNTQQPQGNPVGKPTGLRLLREKQQALATNLAGMGITIEQLDTGSQTAIATQRFFIKNKEIFKAEVPVNDTKAKITLADENVDAYKAAIIAFLTINQPSTSLKIDADDSYREAWHAAIQAVSQDAKFKITDFKFNTDPTVQLKAERSTPEPNQPKPAATQKNDENLNPLTQQAKTQLPPSFDPLAAKEPETSNCSPRPGKT